MPKVLKWFVKGNFILPALIIFLFTACNQSQHTPAIDPETLKLAVAQYNQLLIEGYKNLNMNKLAQAATEERAAKAYFHMAALGEERKRMEAVQRSLSFLRIDIISPDKAEVATLEDWEYTHVNIDSGEVVSRNSLLYELTYSLVNKGNHWLVADITIVNEKALKDDRLKPSTTRTKHLTD